LHRQPELSGKEIQTARRIVEYLRPFKPDRLVEKIGGHGVVASWVFDERGPEVAIRCELDALPIREAGDIPHASTAKGVSHKCGHDGHMAIVAGLAPWLTTRPFDRGTVTLLFQGAEETAEGARSMLDDPRLADFAPDYLFALHNLPGYDLNEILVIDRQFSATVLGLAIYFEGAIAHASQPEKGRDPSLAVSESCIAIHRLINADLADPAYTLATPVYTRIGAPDYGISAGEGELHFTLRTWSEDTMAALIERIHAIVSEACSRYGLEFSTRQFDYFPSVFNDEDCTGLIVEAAESLGYPFRRLPTPMPFGEDFGFFTQRFRGAMFGLGAGLETPPLHNVRYDFPDALLESGTAMFRRIIGRVLSPA
jgi:amidohydrolase